jgi:type IV pilus assembly protein PilC
MGLFSTQISARHMAPLCHQLATHHNAGIPILRSLELIGHQTRYHKVKTVVESIRDDVQRGMTLTDAAARQGRYVPRVFIELLAAGEKGGRLDYVLRDLAKYYEDRLATKRAIAAMMAYPALQLTLGWFLGSFALMIVGQQFSSINALFEWIVWGYGMFQLKVIAAAAILFFGSALLSRLGVAPSLWTWLTTFVWPVCLLTRKFALARFFRTFSLLVSSGMNIVHCVDRAAATTGNPYIQRDLMKAVEPIRQGETLASAFTRCNWIPTMAFEMLTVGEESGDLDVQLRRVSDALLAEAEHAATIAARVLNVAILLGVGLVLGFVIIRFYMNLYGGMLDELGV